MWSAVIGHIVKSLCQWLFTLIGEVLCSRDTATDHLAAHPCAPLRARTSGAVRRTSYGVQSGWQGHRLAVILLKAEREGVKCCPEMCYSSFHHYKRVEPKKKDISAWHISHVLSFLKVGLPELQCAPNLLSVLTTRLSMLYVNHIGDELGRADNTVWDLGTTKALCCQLKQIQCLLHWNPKQYYQPCPFLWATKYLSHMILMQQRYCVVSSTVFAAS